jgi:hypothetical protein
MQMKIDPPGQPSTVSGTSAPDEEEPIVLGPTKARSATTNRMPARVLIISLTLTAALFAIGYLLVR